MGWCFHAGVELVLVPPPHHEGVDGLGGGGVHVNEAVVGARLEVLAGVLVDVRGAQHAVDAALGGQGHGPGHLRLGLDGRLDVGVQAQRKQGSS